MEVQCHVVQAANHLRAFDWESVLGKTIAKRIATRNRETNSEVVNKPSDHQ